MNLATMTIRWVVLPFMFLIYCSVLYYEMKNENEF